MKNNLPSIERRFTAGKVEIRSDAGGKAATVRGYAAMFDKRSENLGGFVEVIKRGAFDEVLKDDVRALFNHDANLILARSRNGQGTLRFGVDPEGLWYEFTPPDTQAGRDLLVSLQRGDVDQSSFAFSVKREGQDWKDEEGGKLMVRTISKVARLYDVSPVTYPAYPDTTVASRELAEFRSAGKGKKETRADAPPAYNEEDAEYACEMLDELQELADEAALIEQTGANADLKKSAAEIADFAKAKREELLAWVGANGIDPADYCDDDEIDPAASQQNSHNADRLKRELELAEAEL